jgi:hypothetical protein
VVAVARPSTLFRHPSIRTLVEPSVRGARCSMVSIQPGAAISESVSKTRGVLAVVQTGRFRLVGVTQATPSRRMFPPANKDAAIS